MHRRHSTKLGLVALATLAASLAACGDEGIGGKNNVDPAGPRATPASQNAAGQLSPSSSADQDFVATAAQDGRLEVELGKIAQERASRDAVKQFGEQMVRDHKAANEKLEALAQQHTLTVPAGLSSEGETKVQTFRTLDAEQFDRAYVQAMTEAHQKAVDLFQRKAKSGDSALQQFAASTLPTLQSHLQHAEQLAQGGPPAQAGLVPPSSDLPPAPTDHAAGQPSAARDDPGNIAPK